MESMDHAVSRAEKLEGELKEAKAAFERTSKASKDAEAKVADLQQKLQKAVKSSEESVAKARELQARSLLLSVVRTASAFGEACFAPDLVRL